MVTSILIGLVLVVVAFVAITVAALSAGYKAAEWE